MHSIELIGISGKAETGKDYITQHILRPLGYYQFSFAWHFKVWLAGKGTATYEEIFHTKPDHVRTLLQDEGTKYGREIYGESIWSDVMENWFKVFQEYWGITKFVIPDVRFFNEITAIKQLGGKILRIHAPNRSNNNRLTSEQRLHTSETQLDEYTGFDGVIYNDPEVSHTTKHQVYKLLNL